MGEALSELRQRLAEIHDLERALGVLGWDQRTMMPPRGAPARAEALATLGGLVHERFVDDETGRLLDRLAPLEESLPYDSDEASIIRVTRRDWEKARRVPSELAAEMAKLSSEAQEVWAKARQDDDYEAFRPYLDRTLELKQRYVACFEPYDDPYDPLLDDYEPGLKTPEVREIFETLKEALVPLIGEVGSTGEDDFMRGPFPEEGQRAISLRIIERFG